MLKVLMPKEDKYFEDFKEMINFVDQMGLITLEFFSSQSYDESIFLKLKPLEKRCDEIASKVIKRLNNSFITPFDREDIFSIIKKIDGIGDLLLATCALVDTYSLTQKVNGAKELANVIKEQISVLKSVFNSLKSNSGVIEKCKAVKDLESQADQLYRTNMKILFSEEKDAITLFKKKEILDGLENTADKCQSAANVIMSISLKNS